MGKVTQGYSVAMYTNREGPATRRCGIVIVQGKAKITGAGRVARLINNAEVKFSNLRFVFLINTEVAIESFCVLKRGRGFQWRQKIRITLRKIVKYRTL